MEIKRIRLFRVSPPGDTWLWLSIETKRGLIGWGEVSHSGKDDMVATAFGKIAPELERADSRKIVDLNQRFYRWKFLSVKNNRFAMTAWSGIDQALWDLLAQSLQVPLYCLLGGYGKNRVPLYANLNRALRKGSRLPQELKEQGERALGEGFSTVKCTPFDEVTPNLLKPSFDLSIQRIQALASVYPMASIALDCHQRFNPNSLSLFLEKLDESPYWIEDAIDYTGGPIQGRDPRITWAGGETCLSIREILDLMNKDVLDIFMPDVKHFGGVSGIKQIIPIIEERGHWVSLHNPSSPLSTAFSAHLTTLCRNPIPLEIAFGGVKDRKEAVVPPENISAGVYRLSDEMGVGVKPRKEYLLGYGKEWREGQWKPLPKPEELEV